MSPQETTIATWPQTGHRLVRALNLSGLVRLEVPNPRQRLIDLIRLREGEFTGKFITLFVVEPSGDTILQHTLKTGSSITETTVPDSEDDRKRAYGYLLSIWPLTNNGSMSRKNLKITTGINAVYPGPMEMTINSDLYTMLGIEPPWLWPADQLTEFIHDKQSEEASS